MRCWSNSGSSCRRALCARLRASQAQLPALPAGVWGGGVLGAAGQGAAGQGAAGQACCWASVLHCIRLQPLTGAHLLCIHRRWAALQPKSGPSGNPVVVLAQMEDCLHQLKDLQAAADAFAQVRRPRKPSCVAFTGTSFAGAYAPACWAARPELAHSACDAGPFTASCTLRPARRNARRSRWTAPALAAWRRWQLTLLPRAQPGHAMPSFWLSGMSWRTGTGCQCVTRCAPRLYCQGVGRGVICARAGVGQSSRQCAGSRPITPNLPCPALPATTGLEDRGLPHKVGESHRQQRWCCTHRTRQRHHR